MSETPRQKRPGTADTIAVAPKTEKGVVGAAAAPTMRAPEHITRDLSEPALAVADTQTTLNDTLQDPLRSQLPSGIHQSGTLGRFTIIDILGSGGMGVVLAAYDPQLDRKVAIKVLRTRGLTGKRREKEAARLLREARAMAQLSHPHVITVYEAGTIDERVFIAMEYIEGMTLRTWLADTKRSVPEILEAYVKAGRGLAAGHAANMVHRDFKPDNVLVGNDGRVRVIDFGLARPTRGAVLDTPSDETSSDSLPLTPDRTSSPSMSSAALHLQLTTAGTLFGTPMYMAPEQHNKVELDTRADQFAFCVAVFEALYGRMPFPAASYAELCASVTLGEISLPAPSPEIPDRVMNAILRGLRTKPDDRFPSMDALLAELEPQTARRRGLAVVSMALGDWPPWRSRWWWFASPRLTTRSPIRRVSAARSGSRVSGIRRPNSA